MKTRAIEVILVFSAFYKLTAALQCFTTGISWPKECTMQHYQPACLKAIVYDGWYKICSTQKFFLFIALLFSLLRIQESSRNSGML
jgi:hypothetical protein